MRSHRSLVTRADTASAASGRLSTRRLKSCQTSSRYSQDREACRRTDSPRSRP